MIFTLRYSKKAQKAIKNLSATDARRIVGALEDLSEEERPELFVKRLTDSPLYSLRVGVYRVILSISHDQCVILALKLAHRRNVYSNH
ncbi:MULTISPECIES: type II toxin-antitoxin system RelE/ParE family toxin [unclassified Methanocalculus]|uniref:type II toxin-antitoxin system RelE family toxin n=1 Tax=Methanocalculus TaxID=71151 RepID=UPI00345DF2AA